MTRCILSIDVGIKNLALAILSKTSNDTSSLKLHAWDLICLLDVPEQIKCTATTVKSTPCTRWSLNGSDLCKTHGGETVKVSKSSGVKSLSPYVICKRLNCELDAYVEKNGSLLSQVNTIVIEKQPTENPKMLMVSHFVFARLVHHFPDILVQFVPAYNKLSVYTGPAIQCTLKTAYAQRKYIGIKQMEWYLTQIPGFCAFKQLFEGSKKKDDLSDCVLQGIWYLDTKKAAQPKTSYKKRRRRKRLHF